MTQGWECPKCHRVYSPTVTECGPCNAAARPPEVWPWSGPWGVGGAGARCFGCGQPTPCDGQTSGCVNPKVRVGGSPFRADAGSPFRSIADCPPGAIWYACPTCVGSCGCFLSTPTITPDHPTTTSVVTLTLGEGATADDFGRELGRLALHSSGI